MQRDHPRFMLGIFGGSGSGKTTYALRFISSAKAEVRFIFDPEGEFSHALKLPWVNTPDQIDAAIKTGFVCYDPQGMYPGNNEEGFKFFARYAYRASALIPRRKFFVVDELGRYTSGSDVPHDLKLIVQSGRRYGLDGVFISQQPNELHNTVRCQLSEVVCFQLTDDTALEFPRKFGFNPEAIRNLGPHQFICRNNRGREVRG